MKAKEYFEKYEEQIIADGPKGTAELFNEMFKEMESIHRKRHIRTDEGTLSVIKEFNQKWNAIVTQFERKHGDSPLVWNGYKELLKALNPVLAEVL